MTTLSKWEEKMINELKSILRGNIMSSIDFAMYMAKANNWDVDQREKHATETEKKLLALLSSPNEGK